MRVMFRGLRAHALRTALTTLGIVIGVAAVITMVALPPARGSAWPSRSRAWAPTWSSYGPKRPWWAAPGSGRGASPP